MGMELRREQAGIFYGRRPYPPETAVRAFLSVLLAVALLATSATPQSLAGPQGSSSAATTAKTSEPSAPRPDKNRAQNSYETGRRAEQAGDWKSAYAAYTEATAYAPGGSTPNSGSFRDWPILPNVNCLQEIPPARANSFCASLKSIQTTRSRRSVSRSCPQIPLT
jgi:hypothetical protein